MIEWFDKFIQKNIEWWRAFIFEQKMMIEKYDRNINMNKNEHKNE